MKSQIKKLWFYSIVLSGLLRALQQPYFKTLYHGSAPSSLEWAILVLSVIASTTLFSVSPLYGLYFIFCVFIM